MRIPFRLVVAFTAAVLVLVSGPVQSRADLLITPKRIVLDETSRDAVFRLVNRADEAKTYELVWRQLRMNADGVLVDAGDDAPGAASGLVLAAPMRVTLGPGGRQTIRINPRLPDHLPEGEYMSHLTFRPVGGAGTGQSENGTGSDVRLQVRVGFSVPVIVRHGQLEAAVQVQPTAIDTEAGTVSVSIGRTGNASTYGNLELYWGQPGADGVQVGRLDGVAVYANVTQRQVDVPLIPPSGVKIGPGLLMVRYMDPDANDVLAEAAVRLE